MHASNRFKFDMQVFEDRSIPSNAILSGMENFCCLVFAKRNELFRRVMLLKSVNTVHYG